jgi:excisionase family DNA binding protein
MSNHSVETEPLTLTVEEAAELLGLSRPLAYEQARKFLATDGREGIPCIRFGRRVVVPRVALERLLLELRL